MYKFFLGIPLLWSCSGKEDSATPPALEETDTAVTDSDTDVDDSDTQEAVSCGSSAPTITNITCEANGMYTDRQAQEDKPSMVITTSVNDPDGDLTTYGITIMFDEEADGVASGSETFSLSGEIDSPDCQAQEADLGSILLLSGDSPDFETTYEWYVVVSDSEGNESAVGTVVCTTPDEFGNESDGEEPPQDTAG